MRQYLTRGNRVWRIPERMHGTVRTQLAGNEEVCAMKCPEGELISGHSNRERYACVHSSAVSAQRPYSMINEHIVFELITLY